jgi:superfamily II DNA or RNA helicase
MTLSLQSEYRSSGSGSVADFFCRVLPAAITYKRAVGFFNSSVFSVESKAWTAFFASKGVMQLVCSERFSPADLSALEDALINRPRWKRREWTEISSTRGAKTTQDFLAWLIANDLLVIKIAFVVPGNAHSMYHEKIGLFEDAKKSALAISGSANESANAWVNNFERVDVFTSWRGPDEDDRCQRVKRDFERLWQDATPGVKVRPLVECVLSGLLKPSGDDTLSSTAAVGDKRGIDSLARARAAPAELIVPPAEIHLFDHQRKAIKSWGASNGRGLLEMATGSGKTITALHLASRLYELTGPGLCIVVVAPFIHLMDQWIKVAGLYGLRPIRCAEGIAIWQGPLAAAIDSLNSKQRSLLSVAVTAATLNSPAFTAQITRVRTAFLFIGDEAHSYGAASAAVSLPANAQYRLGLSATPTRWMDPEGTQRLADYFGPVVFQYGLREAIRDQVLTPYRYYPDLVPLSDEEFEEYVELSTLIKRYCRGEPDEESVSDAAKSLLIKRARLVASARGKLPRLRQMLSARREDDHILVYCGDGSTEGPQGDELVRQVDAVIGMLGNELGMRCASYTARTPAARRQELLEEFDSGFIQVLVAIRCLDEGVDIPSTRTAFILASSTNPRQFVQRRGRVLRRHSSKSRAEIYDFFAVPPPEEMVKGAPGYESARTLVRSQVQRAAEFASLAENGPIARGILVDLMSKLHLLDVWD